MTMRNRIMRILLFPAMLLAALAHADSTDPHALAARWLSQQLQRNIVATQVLSVPRISSFDGCSVDRVRTAITGSTEVEVRCAELLFPQVLLVEFDGLQTVEKHSLPPVQPRKFPLVRAGSRLQADWRAPAMHATIPVIALDSGERGAEIRVRLEGSARVLLHARVLNAHTVEIISAGA
jgi:Chaperone for flagella basal body P-ring formation